MIKNLNRLYIDTEKLCGIIEFFPEKKYLLDFEDFNIIMKGQKKFIFIHTKKCFRN